MPEAPEAEPFDTDVHTWKFGKQLIRVVPVDGQPWLVADDVFALSKLYRNEHLLAKMGDAHVCRCLFDAEGGPVELDIVSYIGAQTIAAQAKFPLVRMIANWMRNRVEEFLTPPGGERPTVPMTLLADGSLPPSPGEASDRYFEFVELRWKWKNTPHSPDGAAKSAFMKRLSNRGDPSTCQHLTKADK